MTIHAHSPDRKADCVVEMYQGVVCKLCALDGCSFDAGDFALSHGETLGVLVISHVCKNQHQARTAEWFFGQAWEEKRAILQVPSKEAIDVGPGQSIGEVSHS
jgi:hypothetical protein